jgi:hypothetical protein
VDSPASLLLFCVVVPVWLLAGVADWLCHRATGIAHTSGTKESAIHLLMFAEVGLPLLALLFLEPDALVLALLLGGFILHEPTALWDVSYASSRRRVTPFEQHVHSFLEILPLVVFLLAALDRPGQLLALFGFGDEAPRWAPALRAQPLPTAYLVGVLVAVLLLEILPYAEELWRCLRSRKRPAVAMNE